MEGVTRESRQVEWQVHSLCGIGPPSKVHHQRLTDVWMVQGHLQQEAERWQNLPPLARETNTRKILKRAGHRLSPSRLVITSPFSCLLNNFWVLIFAFATEHELVSWALGLGQRLNFVYFVHKSFGRNLGSSHA